MFLRALIALTVCVVSLSAKTAHHVEALGKGLNFDTLEVPLKNELGQRLMKAAKNSHHNSVADDTKESLAKAAAAAKAHKDHHVQKKQLTTGSAGVKKTLTKPNADCSGSAKTATYEVVSDDCLSYPNEEVPFSTRYLCAANGDKIFQKFLEVGCVPDKMFDEDVIAPAVKCDMDATSYAEGYGFQMTSTHCDGGASPSYSPGMLQKFYTASDCTGDEWFAHNEHFDVCTFNTDPEDGSYWYTKMLGCTANDGFKVVMFSDANCFHPVAKAVLNMENVNECVAYGGDMGYVKLTCHMP